MQYNNVPWFWNIGNYYTSIVLGEKERDLTQSYDKSLYADRKIQKATWQHKNATKNFDIRTER